MKFIIILLIFLTISCSTVVPRASGIVETWNNNLYEFSQAELQFKKEAVVIDKKNGEQIKVKIKQIKIIRIIHDYKDSE